jgi:hypothetical protein
MAIATITFIVGFLLLPETHGHSIWHEVLKRHDDFAHSGSVRAWHGARLHNARASRLCVADA